MYNTSKYGFTLVELMVVIVLMGILAAIGVPKLTGSIAKAKASEVAPAANSYIKLQNAYVMERKRIGTWRRIGYKEPKSDIFAYDKADIKSKKTVDDLGETGLIGWKATNKISLGGCTSDNTWTVTIAKDGTDSDGNIKLAYKSDVSSSECVAISSGWGTISGNTQVAASDTKKVSRLSVSLYQSKTDSEGNNTLAKSILSADGMIGKGYQSYGVEGFVDKKSAKNAVKSWLVGQLPTGTMTTAVKVVTEFDTDETTLSANKIYKGTASLYYGGEKDDLERLDLYGTKVVYGKLSSDGTKIEYYLDAKATPEQKIDIDNYTGWENNYHQEIEDPMKKDWASSGYVSPITSEDNPEFVSTAAKLLGSTNSGAVEGLEGYSVRYNPEGSTLTDAMVKKNLNTEKVTIVAEMHSDETKYTVGKLYAATVSLLYGNKTEPHLYATREVYAIVTQSSGKALYYEDKECTKLLDLRKKLDAWGKNSGS